MILLYGRAVLIANLPNPDNWGKVCPHPIYTSTQARHRTINDGLVNSVIKCLLSDKKGEMSWKHTKMSLPD